MSNSVHFANLKQHVEEFNTTYTQRINVTSNTTSSEIQTLDARLINIFNQIQKDIEQIDFDKIENEDMRYQAQVDAVTAISDYQQKLQALVTGSVAQLTLSNSTSSEGSSSQGQGTSTTTQSTPIVPVDVDPKVQVFEEDIKEFYQVCGVLDVMQDPELSKKTIKDTLLPLVTKLATNITKLPKRDQREARYQLQEVTAKLKEISAEIDKVNNKSDKKTSSRTESKKSIQTAVSEEKWHEYLSNFYDAYNEIKDIADPQTLKAQIDTRLRPALKKIKDNLFTKTAAENYLEANEAFYKLLSKLPDDVRNQPEVVQQPIPLPTVEVVDRKGKGKADSDDEGKKKLQNTKPKRLIQVESSSDEESDDEITKITKKSSSSSSTSESENEGKTKRKPGPYLPAGLCNPGNNCYFNAMMQILLNEPALLAAYPEASKKEGVHYQPVLDFITAYRKAQKDAYSKVTKKGMKRAQKEGLPALSARATKKTLDYLLQLSALSTNMNKLKKGRQEDIADAISIFLGSAPKKAAFATSLVSPYDPSDIERDTFIHPLNLNLETESKTSINFDSLLTGYLGIINKVFERKPPILMFSISRMQQTQKAPYSVKFNDRKGKEKKILFSSGAVEDAKDLMDALLNKNMEDGFYISKGKGKKGHYFEIFGMYWYAEEGHKLKGIRASEYKKILAETDKKDIVNLKGSMKIGREPPKYQKYKGKIAIDLDRIVIPNANLEGEEEIYKVTSMAMQHGDLDSGHYTTWILKEGDGWYETDDETVTPKTNKEAADAAQKCYLFTCRPKAGNK